MKPKTLIPFIVILVVLAAIALLRDTSRKTPSIIEQTRLETLTQEGLKARDIERIELYAGPKPEEKVVLLRDGDMWRVTTHFNAPVAADAINTYLDNMLGLKGEYRATAETDDQLAPYSLAENEAFHLKAYTANADAPAIDLLFGKAPDFRSVFVRKANDHKVFIEANNLRKEAGLFDDDLSQAPTADKWLNKDIVKIDKEQVTKIALTTPDNSVVLEKQAKEVPQPDPPAEEASGVATPPAPPVIEHEWVLAAGGPSGNSFKQTGLDSLLQKLVAFTATTVVDPEKRGEWGLDNPAFKAIISLEGKPDILLEGGRPDPAGNGYIRLADAKEDVIYEVSKYNFEGLFPKGSDLFDLPKLALTDISRIEINQPEGKVVAQKEGLEWNIIEPAVELNPQKTALTTLANTLSNWQAAGYADESAVKGDFNRTLTVTAGDAVRTLTIGGDAASLDGVYARLDGNATTLIMNRTDLNRFLLKPRDLFELRAMNFFEEDITGVDVTFEGDVFSLAKDGDKWSLRLDANLFDADEDAIVACLSLLSGLQAESFNADVRENWQPTMSIALSTASGDVHSMSMMKEDHLMRVAGKNADLVLSQEDTDQLAELLAALKTPKIAIPDENTEETEAAPVTETLEPVETVAPIEEAPAIIIPENGEVPVVDIGELPEVVEAPEEALAQPSMEMAPVDLPDTAAPLSPENVVPAAPETGTPAIEITLPDTATGQP